MELINTEIVATDLEALRLASVTSGKPVAEYIREGVQLELQDLVATNPAVRAAFQQQVEAYDQFLADTP